MPETRTYVVKRDGFLLGNWRNHNAQVDLTEAQAKQFLREGRIAHKEEPKPQPTAKAERQG